MSTLVSNTTEIMNTPSGTGSTIYTFYHVVNNETATAYNPFYLAAKGRVHSSQGLEVRLFVNPYDLDFVDADNYTKPWADYLSRAGADHSLVLSTNCQIMLRLMKVLSTIATPQDLDIAISAVIRDAGGQVVADMRQDVFGQLESFCTTVLMNRVDGFTVSMTMTVKLK